ncbi:hypothetical protein [Candidatus Halocynthiibacter alkanivorans]|uniref:hypothetical protein n=1 Tax=Candidatus Halocynthiibacter alkanivorans TaxID=2267619 RepID=UPI000DF33448|nr:hypothetical protein [Candidatus Halocynthiibacter alkanivorans]
MFMTRSPIDELARIRAEMGELRAREAALEIEFLENYGPGKHSGFSWELYVEKTAHQIFDISMLPDAVLNDPKYYSSRNSTRIRLEPRHDTPLVLTRDRPGTRGIQLADNNRP